MSKEKTNELYVAIATQKGGIGKSTITMLLANYLHNIGGMNVGVVDCDDPQHSISDARERELLLIKNNEADKEAAKENNEADKEAAKDVFRKTGKRIFPVVATNPVDALDQAEILIEDENPDIVLFDLPGTIRSKGVLSTLSQMDYIFVPISADRLVFCPHQCRQAGIGECAPVRCQLQGQSHDHWQGGHQRDMPVLDDGGWS